jgi:FkbM family methyltransferase
MSIILKTIKNYDSYDLSKSEKFLSHHNTSHSKTQAILEQFGNGFYSFLEDNKDVVMIDLGANIGLFSLYMSSICSEIYSVEPTPSHVEIMKDLLENLEVKNIFPHQIAIHTKNGEAEFQLNGSNSTMNSFFRHGIDPGGSDSVTVPTTTLANFIKNVVKKRVNFVKMDIEGFENVIVHDPSFEDAIKEIDVIYVEVHDFEGVGKMEENVNKVISRLESLGKKTMKLTYDGVLGYEG